jgi:hypothetical protein
MFCEPDQPDCKQHWCPECKYIGCDMCCGCGECLKLGRAGFTPKTIPLSERTPHPREEN